MKKTLEELLRMMVNGTLPVTGENIEYSPEFRVSVQKISDEGVHFIIHAHGHNSDTLDFLAIGNELKQL